MGTESEQLFEAYCTEKDIFWERISPSDEARPDYRIVVYGKEIIVEVKQIDMNPDEQGEYGKFVRGQMAEGGGTPGERVRKKISEGNKQISIVGKGKHPSLLVVYDNTPLGYHTDPYNMRVGMYGLDTIVLAIPAQPGIRSYVKDRRFGPKRKMTKTANTSTSAVAAMFKATDDTMRRPYLVIYHNVFANIPIEPALFKAIGVRQFKLEEAVEGKYQEWVEVT